MSKESIQMLKADIKTIAAQQKSLKNQRKTIHLEGERTMPSYEATWKHATYRNVLRHMYIAYGFMREKTIQQIEGVKENYDYSTSHVEKIIAKYEQALCSDKK